MFPLRTTENPKRYRRNLFEGTGELPRQLGPRGPEEETPER